MDNFPPMRRISLLLLTGAFLASSCKKEDPMLKATLHAKCRECVVSYASGVSQSKKDTLLGVVDQGSGDTIAEERQWTLQLKDCLLYTSPSPRDRTRSRMPSSA